MSSADFVDDAVAVQELPLNDHQNGLSFLETELKQAAQRSSDHRVRMFIRALDFRDMAIALRKQAELAESLACRFHDSVRDLNYGSRPIVLESPVEATSRIFSRRSDARGSTS
jgi:tRNA(Met) C34 N-acetyltransferase TmcA